MPAPCGGVQGRVAVDFSMMVNPSRPSPSLASPQAPSATAPRRQWLLPLGLAVLAVAAAHLLDHGAWSSLRDPRVYDRDWGRLLRSVGYLPTWLIVAIGIWTHERPAPGWGWRGGFILLTPALGGALAEVLKLCIRRLRPDADAFGYAFRDWSDRPFSTGGLGMPSSHTLVAFAGAAAMARVFPRARWLWFLLAGGCGLTRVMANAHFLSDVVAAAALGWLVSDALSRWMLGREHRQA